MLCQKSLKFQEKHLLLPGHHQMIGIYYEQLIKAG